MAGLGTNGHGEVGRRFRCRLFGPSTALRAGIDDLLDADWREFWAILYSARYSLLSYCLYRSARGFLYKGGFGFCFSFRFVVQRLLGHANLKMATRYVQDVSKQTDKVIKNSRKYVI